MAADIGVDRLCWELTDHPEDMFSRRFLPGSPELAAIKREVWDDNNLGNAIPGATPGQRSRCASREVWRPRSAGSNLPMIVRSGRPVRIAATVRNLSTRPFPAQASYGRRLVRLGAQLCDRDRHRHQPRLRARLAARHASSRTIRAGADDHHRAVHSRALRVEVRSGERGNRLVRGVWVGDDDEDADCGLALARQLSALSKKEIPAEN